MNFLSLRYFIEVSNHLSFSKASKILHISQPGLSQQISTLENQLGFKLLNRTTRKITLTEEGEYIYKKLAPSFDDIEKTVSNIVENKIVPKPKIKIATIPSAASIYIPNLLKKILIEFPEVEVDLQETTSARAVKLVKQQKYHIGFIRTPIHNNLIANEGVNMIEFERSPLQLVVSFDHWLAQKDSIQLHEAKNEPFIHYHSIQAHSLQFLLEKACSISGFSPKKLCEGSELLTIANLVSNNLGVALMPKDMIDLLETKKVKAIDIENVNLSSSISAVWKNSEQTPFLIDKIIHTLQTNVLLDM
ncbi:LysR family transcriptional regulator [Peribacillus sp. NPDC097675]|uniref:LysR family transcriptional regulator n=1 Tax=Peribacillus sp. NPDC097675 TaxID=3390618 RepID=UPI003CFFABDE